MKISRMEGREEDWWEGKSKQNLCAKLEITVIRVQHSEHSKECRPNQTLPYHWHCVVLKSIFHLSRTSSPPTLSDILQKCPVRVSASKHTSKSRSRTNRRSSTFVGMAIFILSLREATVFC